MAIDPLLDANSQVQTFDRAHFIRLGVFAAAGYLFVLTALYVIDRKLVLNPGLDLLIANVFYWSVIIKAISDFKIQNDFEMTLGEGLKAGFVSGLFVSLTYHVFMYVLFNFIDPSMIEVQMEVIKDTINTVGGFIGAGDVPDDVMGDMESALDEVGMSGYPFTALVVGLSQSLMYVLIVSLIVSAIKKNR